MGPGRVPVPGVSRRVVARVERSVYFWGYNGALLVNGPFGWNPQASRAQVNSGASPPSSEACAHEQRERSARSLCVARRARRADAATD